MTKPVTAKPPVMACADTRALCQNTSLHGETTIIGHRSQPTHKPGGLSQPLFPVANSLTSRRAPARAGYAARARMHLRADVLKPVVK